MTTKSRVLDLVLEYNIIIMQIPWGCAPEKNISFKRILGGQNIMFDPQVNFRGVI